MHDLKLGDRAAFKLEKRVDFAKQLDRAMPDFRIRRCARPTHRHETIVTDADAAVSWLQGLAAGGELVCGAGDYEIGGVPLDIEEIRPGKFQISITLA